MAGDVTLRMLLVGEDKSASKALKGVGTAAEGAAKKASLAGSVMKGVLSAGLIDKASSALLELGQDSIKSFAELEDATAAAGVVFGNSMSEIETAATSAADKFGVSKQEYIDGAITMGTFGKSAGLAGSDLSGFSNKLVQTAADMASFRGTTPQEAIEAVGAALRGESEPIRKYGVLLDDASLRQEALRQGLVKTTKSALTPQQKVLAAQALILKQTTDAQGDFARTSESTANTQKRLAAEAENFKAVLGGQLAPAMVEVQSGLSNLLDTAGDGNSALGPLTDTATALATAFNQLTTSMKDAEGAGAFLKPVMDGLNNVTGVAQVQGLAKAYLDWSGANKKAADNATTHAAAIDEATGAAQDNTTATQGNTTATQGNSNALETNAEKLHKVYTERLKLRGDKRALEAAIDSATAAFKKNGRTLDENTPKGRANAQALDDIASAGLAVGGNMNRARNAFINAATSMGKSKAEAKKLADQLGLIKSKKVTITAQVRKTGITTVSFERSNGSAPRWTVIARARGGAMNAGRPYLVGEEGPELVTPSRGGWVHTAAQTRSMAAASASGGGDTYYIDASGLLSESQAADRIERLLTGKKKQQRGRPLAFEGAR